MSLLPVGGLASGMDTEEVIRKIIEAESLRKNMETRRKENLKAKKAAWSEVKTQLQTLRSKLDSIRFSSSFQQRSITVSDETIATATVSAGTTVVGHTLKVKSLATAHQVRGTSTVTDPNARLDLSGSIAITVGNGTATAVEVKPEDSITAVKDRINKAGVGVTADLVKVVNGASTSYQLVITSNSLGEAGRVKMDSALLGDDKLKFKAAGATSNTDPFLTEQQPTDAVFKLDGQMYTMGTNTIADVLPGISLTLKKAQPWPDLGPEPEAVDLTVAQDPSKSIKAVKDWAEAVNDTLSKLQELTKYNSADGSSGALNGEALAKSMAQKLRGMLTLKVGGLPNTMNQLSQAGVTTGAWGTDDYGRLVVDEAKLEDQLKADPDAVARVFGALTDKSTTGVAKDMYDYVNGTLKFQTGDISKRDEALSTRIKDLDDRILALDDKLGRREVELRRQFTRMEQAMSRLQAQGNAFMSQILSFTAPAK